MSMLVTKEPETIGMLVAQARQVLDQAGVSNAAREVSWLLEHALGLRSHQLASDAERILSREASDRVKSLVGRRAAREPLQYILGTQEFCGLEFQVTPQTLIPRPETEVLIQEVVRRAERNKETLIVDVGTGSGCIAVTLAAILKEARLIGIDRSSDALNIAKNNASSHAVDGRIEWLEGDLLAPLTGRGFEGCVDIIVSNPPYIAESDWAELQPEVRLFEPRSALVAGPQGTEFHGRLLQEAKQFLSVQGLLLMEIGQGQAVAVQEMAKEIGGYAPVTLVEDAAGIERVAVAQRVE